MADHADRSSVSHKGKDDSPLQSAKYDRGEILMPRISVSVADDLQGLALDSFDLVAYTEREKSDKRSVSESAMLDEARFSGEVGDKEEGKTQGKEPHRDDQLEQYLSSISCPKNIRTKRSESVPSSDTVKSMLRDIQQTVLMSDPRHKDKKRPSPTTHMQEYGIPLAVSRTQNLPFSSACAQTAYGNGLQAMDSRLGPEHFIQLLEEQG